MTLQTKEAPPAYHPQGTLQPRFYKRMLLSRWALCSVYLDDAFNFSALCISFIFGQKMPENVSKDLGKSQLKVQKVPTRLDFSISVLSWCYCCWQEVSLTFTKRFSFKINPNTRMTASVIWRFRKLHIFQFNTISPTQYTMQCNTHNIPLKKISNLQRLSRIMQNVFNASFPCVFNWFFHSYVFYDLFLEPN